MLTDSSAKCILRNFQETGHGYDEKEKKVKRQYDTPWSTHQ